ncbi:unnamed protein product, partial [Gongylonema pulchrum]|uniref:Gag-pol polyprotein n=1 Tax=Gongylonema pulchrum TaxID=637853 RepID=A0A183D3B5_9BILA
MAGVGSPTTVSPGCAVLEVHRLQMDVAAMNRQVAMMMKLTDESIAAIKAAQKARQSARIKIDKQLTPIKLKCSKRAVFHPAVKMIGGTNPEQEECGHGQNIQTQSFLDPGERRSNTGKVKVKVKQLDYQRWVWSIIVLYGGLGDLEAVSKLAVASKQKVFVLLYRKCRVLRLMLSFVMVKRLTVQQTTAKALAETREKLMEEEEKKKKMKESS